MRRAAQALLLAVTTALPACGGGEARRVEDAVRERPHLAAGRIVDVKCTPHQQAWGCVLRLADGRTQACQARVRDGKATSVACQPLRAE